MTKELTPAPMPETSAEFLRDLVMRLRRSTLSRLKRTSPEALYWQPDAHANSIGVTTATRSRRCRSSRT